MVDAPTDLFSKPLSSSSFFGDCGKLIGIGVPIKCFILLVMLTAPFGATKIAIGAESTQDIWSKAAVAHLQNSEAKAVGEAKLLQTPQGVLIRLELSNFAPGTHAFHIHAVGKCDPPAFTSAGGHFNPSGKKHGTLNPEGKHFGDLTNIHVPENGALTIEVLAPHVNIEEGDNKLLDEDGSALVIHAGPDDYQTDPAGAAGGRIACGVIVQSTTK